MLIYWFSSSFRMGDALPGPGRSPMGLYPAGRAVVPKERFLHGLQPTGRAVFPFSWCWLVCLCHMIKTTKMADKLDKALTFQRETNILHHYKGIFLLKLVAGPELSTRFVWESGIDPSGSIWPNPTQTLLLIHMFPTLGLLLVGCKMYCLRMCKA